MANATYQQQSKTSPARAAGCDAALPVCSACGGLECLCRPRFFNGQLLTDDDLNRLDRYIVAKTKLHNRYLQGWGVVCGLEVICDPCGKGVTVRPGYALSPCGEDIVVCKDTPVDICRLVDDCRQRTPGPDCDPPLPWTAADCKGVSEDWVLAICYTETPSRGVTALRGASDCRPTPVSGGSGACGCTAAKQPTAPTPTLRRQAAQCEPTLTCETFTFRVYRAPKTEAIVETDFMRRVECCLKTFKDQLGTVPRDAVDPAIWTRWCCDFKTALHDLIVESGTADCRLLERLDSIRCSNPEKYYNATSYFPGHVTTDYWTDAFKSIEELFVVAAELLRSCICRSLLPACPDAPEQDCVPLARLAVDQSTGCRVVSICNWTDRRQLVTWPAILEWVSPIFQLLGREIGRACCTPLTVEDLEAFNLKETFGPAAVAKEAARKAPMTVEPGQVWTTLVKSAFADRARPANLYTLVLGALGVDDKRGDPIAQPFELENPAAYLMLNQILRPLVERMAPDVIRMAAPPAVAPPAPPPAAPAGAPSSAAEMKRLRETVANLEKSVAKQSAEITKLKRRPNK